MEVPVKYKLLNENVLLWLGDIKDSEKDHGIDNVLILDRGEVLLLKRAITIPLFKK